MKKRKKQIVWWIIIGILLSIWSVPCIHAEATGTEMTQVTIEEANEGEREEKEKRLRNKRSCHPNCGMDDRTFLT